jgi:hypothetical protein
MIRGKGMEVYKRFQQAILNMIAFSLEEREGQNRVEWETWRDERRPRCHPRRSAKLSES